MTFTRKKLLKLGAAMLVPTIPACAGVQNTDKFEHQATQHQFTEHQFSEHKFDVTSFQDYHPVSSREKIQLEDKLLEMYLAKPFELSKIRFLANVPGLLEMLGEEEIMNERNNLEILDYDTFRSQVLEVALELGVKEEEVKTMSIYDSILLSGKIVAYKLDYNHEMLKDGPKDKRELMDRISKKMKKAMEHFDKGERIPETRNEEALRIDTLSGDQLFFGGTGVCRNYAAVNVAVFNILKESNPNLRNTYMRWYSPEEIEDIIRLPHAWNFVSTVQRSADGFTISSTYVDPTWLDTRNQTAGNTGKKVETTDEEIYNAFDEAHFGSKQENAHKHLSRIYAALGDEERLNASKIGISMGLVEFYQQQSEEEMKESWRSMVQGWGMPSQ